MRGHRDKQGKFDWASAVLDALIISGITFFTGLGTLASSAAISPTSFCVLLSAVETERQAQQRKLENERRAAEDAAKYSETKPATGS